jgi:GT2 family glycosyltransferase
MQHKVYIIILNWNGWHDTIECLESVLRNNYHNYTVIVCDNKSSDNSMEMIRQWANGLINADSSDNDYFASLTLRN